MPKEPTTEKLVGQPDTATEESKAGNAPTAASSPPSGEAQQPNASENDDAAGAGAADANTPGADGNAEGSADDNAGDTDQARENADEFAGRAGRQQKKARSADAVADYKRAAKGRVPFAELPEGESLQLRFADGDAFLSDTPAIEVHRSELSIGTDGRAIYAEPVNFGPVGNREDVTEAWLIAGKKAALCALVVPLPVGGGRTSSIPGGNLIF